MVLPPLVVHRGLPPTRRSWLFGPSTLRSTMPAADSRPTVRMDRSTLSHDAVTCGGSPEVNSTAFNAQPPDLPPVCLVDTGFAVICQLAPHRRPHHPDLVHRLAPLIGASVASRSRSAIGVASTDPVRAAPRESGSSRSTLSSRVGSCPVPSSSVPD